jgi:PAS domain S-box-containing protein
VTRNVQTPASPASSQDLSAIEALSREVERLRVLASRDRGVLAAILEHSPHGIIVCDANGQLVLQSRAAERIWAGSATAKDVDGWRAYHAFHPDGRPFEPQDWGMAQCLATRKVIDARELHIQRFDGSFGYLLASSAPLIGDNAELDGSITVFADITRLKQSELEAGRLQADLATKIQDLEAFARRASLLQKITAAIGRAMTVDEVAEVVTAHGRQLFGATASLLYRRDGARLVLVAAAGVPPERLTAYRDMQVDADAPLPQAMRTGTPVWLASRSEIATAFPPLTAVALDGMLLEAVVALPLSDGSEVVGGLAFSFYASTTLDAVQRDFYLTVADQCAQGMRRARSFEAERNARQALQRQQESMAVLAAASETLSSTLDSRKALAELTKMVVPTIADWCAIDELGPDGKIRRLAVEHRDPAKITLAQQLADKYPTDPDAARGVPAVLRTGKTEWVPEVPDALLVAAAKDAQHLEIARALRLTSYAIVPIVARGRVLGTLSLVCERQRRLVEQDLHFAEELARRAASALENAHLYEAAEAARAHLHGLFMQAPAAISIGQGREHRFELANQPYQRLVGTPDLIGKSLREACPELAAQVGKLIERVYDSGTTFTASELPMMLAGAPTRYSNVVYQPVRTTSGAISGVATFAFDVTDSVLARQRSEALASVVALSAARMRALVDATAAIVWTSTATGEVVEVSPSWLAFTGQSAAEYLDGGFLDAIHPDDRERTMELWTAAVAARIPYAAEYRLHHHARGYAHTLARGMPVFDEAGAVREYVGCNVDITELRLAEEAARRHAETLGTVNELGRLISAELDQQTVVQAVTDAATSLTGAQFGAFFYNVVDERGGSYMLYALSGVPRAAFSKFPMPRNTAVFAPTFAGEAVIRVDDITKDPRYGQSAPYHGMPEGHLPVRSYLAVPVVSRSAEVIGGIFLGHAQAGVFDERAETLTKGLAAQAAVAVDNARLFGKAQNLIRALEQTNRELDQFAYVASHDLKAPLRGISNLAEWIEEDLGPALPPETRKKMDLLRGRVRRMEALIQGILDLSRAGREAGKREHVDVGRLAIEIAELLAPTPPASVTVSGGMPVLETERVALQQIFMNLIGNALKHAGKADALVQVSARESGDVWEFRISDNGPGIAPEYHERIWGIFQTLEARDRVENTGIGLAVVKKLVEARGARAWVEPNQPQGATFCFTWPKHEPRSS